MSQSSLSWRNEEVTINAKHHLHVLFEPDLRGGGGGRGGKVRGQAGGVCGRGLTVSFSWVMARSSGWCSSRQVGVQTNKSNGNQTELKPTPHQGNDQNPETGHQSK